jgi:hypothetical protein
MGEVQRRLNLPFAGWLFGRGIIWFCVLPRLNLPFAAK